MILMNSILDMIGVASILPFMAILTNPTIIETNAYLNYVFYELKTFGVNSEKDFLFVIGIFVFLLLIFSLALKAFTSYLQVKFVQMHEYEISRRLMKIYLYQPYHWFLSQNSAQLGRNILSEVSAVVGGGLRPLVEVLAKGSITILLIILLIFVNPKITIIISLSLIVIYFAIFSSIQKYLKVIGKKRLDNNLLRFKIINEAFSAVKELKLRSSENIYIKNFSKHAKTYGKTQAMASAISLLPRYILEGVAFGGILLLILYLMSQSGSVNKSLPLLSLYVFAGYRLLPALQQLYSAFSQLTFIGPSLDKLIEDFRELQLIGYLKNEEKLSFKKSITLNNVNYNYPNSTRATVKDINLSILSKTTVGFVGVTGSGKTTIIDIILGLLNSKSGNLKVDGKIITEQNLRSWQNIIGYVPQHIFLADDTIAANIAFGDETENFNLESIKKSAKIANLHDFVENELPQKYQTIIGERGIRLSGGQRQRIGIARSLYHDPKVLILDEATSALDNQTEKAVMDAINSLNKEITIILIAHRLNTVKKCDKIFLIDKGNLIKEGTFDEIVEIDDEFFKKTFK